jgi:two-component system, cell cycle sensor histidine kinase and response regulator CckA
MTPLPSRRAPYSLLILFVVLATAVAALAYHYHVAQKDAVAQEVRKQLLSVADMKVKNIEAWRQQKLGEGRIVMGNRLLLTGLQRLLQGHATASEQASVSEWLDALCREMRYGGVTLTDLSGAVVVTRGRLFGARDHIRRLAVETATRGDVSLTDFHIDEQGTPVHLGLNVPLRDGAGAAFGALLAGIDPEEYVYPSLQRWPAPSATAETLLVRRDGEQIVFLTPLRKRPNLTSNLRVPVSQSAVAGVRAVVGEEGTIEAQDYTGAMVFAAVQAVPGTTWRLVAKVDAEEVLAPLRWRSGLMGALAISLILAAAAGVFALWRRNQVAWYRDRYEMELQRREAVERYDAERKAMDEELGRTLLALQSSESRLRLAFEQAAVGMNEVSIDGRFLRVNQRFCDITGYAREELQKLSYSDLTHPDDRPADRGHVDQVLSGARASKRWEKRYIRKDGAIIWVAVTASLLRDNSGEPLNMLGVVEDITASVHAQEALRQTEERFRQVVEHAPQGIVVTTGVEARYLNAAAARWFGAESPAQLIGSPVLDRIRADHRPAVRERLATVSAGEPALPAELDFLRLNGDVFPVEVSATPILYDGQVSALVFFRDLTDRKRAEEERTRLEQRLRQAQKMESVGRLAGGVAHDFNNHLTVINGYCDMLLDALGPDDPLREELSEIRAAGDRAAALTQQLLAFSRKQVVEPRPLNLNDVVEEYCRMVRRLIGEDIEVATELDPALGPVLADRGQMHQVLMNLAVNARDAMPDGGTILVTTTNAELADVDPAVADVKPGPYIVLTLSDTGVGMSPETLQKIFEPFFTTKPMGIGTGLGLATVYGIIEQAGGFIRVTSQSGHGTTFRIYLPRIGEDPQAALTPAGSQKSIGGNETVLVVEDQAEVRKLATGILKKNGYSVLEAANGAEALALAAERPGRIDLLLTDLIMPGITGRELAQRLAEARPEIKVLYMSGYSDDLLARDGMLPGSIAYLSKPFAPADLATKVREAIGGTASKGRIIVIDDDAAVLDVFAGILRGAGYQVVTAADGDAGVRLLEAGGAQLVITDLVMPQPEGMEVLKIVRERFPSVPVIAISGAFDGEFLKAASVLGAGATLQKPVAADRLLPAVKGLIG